MLDNSSVRFERVVKEYQLGNPVVDGVSFDVPSGAFIVLLGPSGCGKTTLLKTVNRLVEPSAGSIFVNGKDVRSLEPTALRRSIGYVIQQIGLFPHMTVADNVGVVPTLLGQDTGEIRNRVTAMLDLVHLPADQYANRFPQALSGGQQQRVGLARALAADPEILLMDEPFGALDAIERTRLQSELHALHQRLKKTVLFVTHDIEEALHLADAIVVMRDGRVVQYAPPLEILARPADAFVAELAGAGDLTRRFSLITVGDAMQNGNAPAASAAGIAALPTVRAQSDLRTAFSAMLAAGTQQVRVVDRSGGDLGTLTFENILQAARAAGSSAQR